MHRKPLLACVAMMALVGSGVAAPAQPQAKKDQAIYRDRAAAREKRVDDLMARLTLEEKVSLLAGASSMTLHAIPRLGIPELKMTDGPTGVR